MSQPVSIVICTHNRPKLLERCLRSVARLDYSPVHIIIADNAPETDEAERLAEHHGASYVRVPVRGVSRARNAGARAATGGIVAFLDDDMVVHPKWLSALVREFSDADIVAVTGPIVSMRMTDAADDLLVNEISHRPWGAEPFAISHASEGWFERTNFGGLGDGNFALRASVFRQWHGFEERIGRGMPLDMGEEHYAFFELLEKGYRAVYTPSAIVFHADRVESPERIRHNLIASVAYAGFVMLHHPRHTMRVMRFLSGGFFRRRRPWQSWSAGGARKAVAFTEAIGMGLSAARTLWKTHRSR